jgi:RNA polymerase sigma factor (sigma-70 family)
MMIGDPLLHASTSPGRISDVAPEATALRLDVRRRWGHGAGINRGGRESRVVRDGARGSAGAAASGQGKAEPVLAQEQRVRFEQAVLPHLAAAYNLARWLTRSDQDAEDVVQDAYLRAFKFFGGFHGADSRAWLLAIVRNTCYTWLRQTRAHELDTPFDEELHGSACEEANPETLLLAGASKRVVRAALEELPVEFREMVILRDLEGLSYRQIAEIAGVPLGTVMSRLARGRKRLQSALTRRLSEEA